MSKVTWNPGESRVRQDGTLPWVCLWRDVLSCVELMCCKPSARALYLLSWVLLDRRTAELHVPVGVSVAKYLAKACHFSEGHAERCLEELQTAELVEVHGNVYRVPDLLRFSPAPSGWNSGPGRPRKGTEELSAEALRSRNRRALAHGQNMTEGAPVKPRSNPGQNTRSTGQNTPVDRSYSGHIRPLETLTSSESPLKRPESELRPLALSPVATGHIPVKPDRSTGQNTSVDRPEKTPLAPPAGGGARAKISSSDLERARDVLGVLAASSLGAISTRADGRTLERFARVVSDLRAAGTTVASWESLGRYAGTGGCSWKTQGPLSVGYLAKPGVASKLLDEACIELHRRDARAGGGNGNGSARPSVPPASGTRATVADLAAARAKLVSGSML